MQSTRAIHCASIRRPEGCEEGRAAQDAERTSNPMPSQAQGGAARCAVDESCSRTEGITHGRTQESQSPIETARDEARDEGRTLVSDPRGRVTRARDEAGPRGRTRVRGGAVGAEITCLKGGAYGTRSRGCAACLPRYESNPSHRGLDWGVCRRWDACPPI